MTINKKLATIVLGFGISVSALGVSAKAPTDCYELRDWCVDRVKQFYPNNWWTTPEYQYCLDDYYRCRDNNNNW